MSKDINFSPIGSRPALADAAIYLRHRRCPICDADEDSPVLVLEGVQFFTDSPDVAKCTDVRQAVCRRCHTLYMNPCYSREGFAALFSEAGKTYGATADRYREQTRWLEQRGLIGAEQVLLDVGCYEGDFIASLPKAVDTIGIDIDPGVIERATKRHGQPGRRFICDDFERMEFHESVDVITMFHVLEHLPSPQAVLAKLRSLAHKHTKLVLEVPVLEKGATNDINGYLTLSHLTHFSIRTLEMCVQASGWEILEGEIQPYNGYRVVARPTQDAQDGISPAPYDVVRLHDYLQSWHEALARINEQISNLSGRYFAVWGAGLHTELLYQLTPFFLQDPERRFLLVDGDPLKQGRTWRNVPIESPAVLEGIDWEQSRLLISSYGGQQQIMESAMKAGVPRSRIDCLYDRFVRY